MDKAILQDKFKRIQSKRIDWTLWLCVVLLIYGLVEGAWGVLQLCDVVDSGHPRYPVTGSFYNPGPYGCFVGCLLPLAVRLYIDKLDNKFTKILSGAYILICALLLPGGMSRTGWIAAVMGITIVLIGTNINKLKQLNNLSKILLANAVFAVVIAGGIGAYVLKPDSADGRLLMWKIAAHATTYRPLFGVGWANVAGTYGDAQEAYFFSGVATAHEEMLAGTPAYVFNEYLQIAIAYGIPASVSFAIVLLVTAIIYWRKKQYGLSGVTVALITVMSASYPLQFWTFKILVGIVVVASLLLSHNKYIKAVTVLIWIGIWTYFCVEAQPIDVSLKFRHAQRAQLIGRYDTSNQILRDILQTTSDSMPLNIMGRNYQAMGIRDSAETCFLRAAVRVPNRLYPHYLLMKLYAETPSDSVKMQHQAEIIVTKQPKTHSMAIEEMRQEARRILSNSR